MQEPGAAVACWCRGVWGGDPASLPPCLCNVWHGLLSPHTGLHNNPSCRHPTLSLTPPRTAPPPLSIHGSSFQQVIQTANKEASSFCLIWNVQCQRERRGWGWDSKKAYNLLTKVDWPSPPILLEEPFCGQYVGINPAPSMTKRREWHSSRWHEKKWDSTAL